MEILSFIIIIIIIIIIINFCIPLVSTSNDAMTVITAERLCISLVRHIST